MTQLDQLLAGPVSQDSVRVPLIEIGFETKGGDAPTLNVATVSKVIYAGFDRALSDFLHATQGRAFPRFVATLHEKSDGADGHPKQIAERFFSSIPEALAWIGERALNGEDQARVTVHADFRRDGAANAARPRIITDSDTHALRTAFSIVTELADPAVIDITGDFESLAINPPAESGLRKARVDFSNNIMYVPTVEGGESVQFSVFDLADKMREDPVVRTYSRILSDIATQSKQQAVEEFRWAAEEQILNFDNALGSQPMTGYRAEIAKDLVARLKAGLGDELRGISAHARAIAFDWADAARRDPNARRERQAPPRVIQVPPDARGRWTSSNRLPSR